MPELPEVENVCLSLTKQGTVGQTFAQVELLRKDLRVPFPSRLQQKVKGQTILGIRRHAKYILFETENYVLLSHLGMTGSWRVDMTEPQKHDHVVLHFASGQRLIFNDPRRFGILDIVDKAKLPQSRWLKHLGVEPLSSEFDAAFLFKNTRKRKVPIKGFLMDQRQVVGVGNIYASEALFVAKVKPSRPAGRVTQAESALLVSHIQRILREAIRLGGSTIRDYRNSEGQDGSYQKRFLVYDRKGEPCTVCGSPLKAKFIAGRNTYWCTECQR